MHEPVRSQLEEILQGRLEPGRRGELEAHLAQCEECVTELEEIRLYSSVIRTLHAPAAPEPRPGFYARVMERIETQARPSFWTLFLDPVFGQRLVYATGAMVLLMASFLLATSGETPQLAQTPVEIIVQPASAPAPASPDFGQDVQRDRERFLVQMASFSE